MIFMNIHLIGIFHIFLNPYFSIFNNRAGLAVLNGMLI